MPCEFRAGRNLRRQARCPREPPLPDVRRPGEGRTTTPIVGTAPAVRQDPAGRHVHESADALPYAVPIVRVARWNKLKTGLERALVHGAALGELEPLLIGTRPALGARPLPRSATLIWRDLLRCPARSGPGISPGARQRRRPPRGPTAGNLGRKGSITRDEDRTIDQRNNCGTQNIEPALVAAVRGRRDRRLRSVLVSVVARRGLADRSRAGPDRRGCLRPAAAHPVQLPELSLLRAHGARGAPQPGGGPLAEGFRAGPSRRLGRRAIG